MILRSLVRRDPSDYGDQRAFLGQQDLATFGVIITFIISVFVCAIRFLHRRRDRRYLLHDTLLLTSLFFALVTTITFAVSLQVCATLQDVTSNALKSWLAAVIPFDLTVCITRLAVLTFTLYHFLPKIRIQKRIVYFKITIYVIMAIVVLQVLLATLTTLFSCRPVSAAWNPITYEVDCKYLLRLQRAHASTELFLDTSIMLLITVMYTRTGIEKTEIPFKLAILAVGLLALGTLAGRTSCLTTNLGAYPPIYETTPIILMAVGMNSDLTAAALLILCTSIRHREEFTEIRNAHAQTGLELETRIIIQPKNTRWEELPDLEFKSDRGNVLTGMRQEDVIRSTRRARDQDDAILPVGVSSPRPSLIGLGIRRSINWISQQRNSRGSSRKASRGSPDQNEIWGIRDAVAVTKALPPLPIDRNS